MPKRRLNSPPLMFMLLLPLLRVLPPKTMLKDLTNRLKRHALDIRVEEDNEQPTDEADAAVEAEGPGGVMPFIMLRNVPVRKLLSMPS